MSARPCGCDPDQQYHCSDYPECDFAAEEHGWVNPPVEHAVPKPARKTDPSSSYTYEQFTAEVRTLLDSGASPKGYNQTGPDGPNALYSFVSDVAQGHGHALGEIIYKIVRYSRTGNREDLLKAAAWVFLVLKHERP